MPAPLGIQRGTHLDLTLTGNNLVEPTGLWTSFPSKVTIPTTNNNGKDSGIPEAVRILAKTITKYLNDSMREMVVTVSWERGTATEQLTLSTYLIDLDADFNFSI